MVAGDRPNRAREVARNEPNGDGNDQVASVLKRNKIVPIGPVMDLWLRLVLLPISYMSSYVQVVNLARHGDPFFAIAVAVFTTVGAYYQWKTWTTFKVWSKLRVSAQSRFMEVEVILFFGVGLTSKEMVANLMLAPYAMTFQSNVGWASSFVALLNLALGMKSMAKHLVDSHVGYYYAQLGRSIVAAESCGSCKLTLLTIWCISTFAALTSLNIIFMRVFHPIVFVAITLPILVADRVVATRDETFGTFILSFYREPTRFFASFCSSVFGFGQWNPIQDKEEGFLAERWYSISHLVVIVAQLLLMTFDFPRLSGRSMGYSVFMGEFYLPVQSFSQVAAPCLLGGAEALAAMNYDDWEHVYNQSVYNATLVAPSIHLQAGAGLACSDDALSGANLYKCFLFMLFLIGMPIYIFGMLGLLVFNESFRDGTPTPDRCNLLIDVLEEINASMETQFPPEHD